MGIEHSAEHHVHEEALRGVLALGQIPILEIRGYDAPVVRPVPRSGVRLVRERHPLFDRA
jgi:hypothetical protein